MKPSNQHDVHDAHSADDQRNERHDQQKIRHDSTGRSERLRDFGQVTNLEIIRRAGPDAMTLAEHGGDLPHPFEWLRWNRRPMI